MSEQLDPIYKFKKPFLFDGEEITQIDLSEITDATRKQIETAKNRYYARKDRAPFFHEDAIALLDLYCIVYGKPYDFFDNIGGADYYSLPFNIFGFLGK